MPTIYDCLLLAKIEATKGTDSVPVVGTNAVRIKSGKISIPTEALARTTVKQTMGPLKHLIGKQIMQLEIEVELQPSGAAGTAPMVGVLLLGCATLETIVASTSAAYEPETTPSLQKSLSMYWYEDGLLYKLLGAVGKASFDASIGTVGGFKFTFMAAYAVPTAVSCPSGAVYQSSAPLVMSNADVINDGAAIKVGAFGFDDSTDVQHHYTTGNSEFVVAGRTPKMKLTKDSVSTAAEWAALTAGTDVSMSATFGATAGNRLIFTAPVARRESVTPAQRADRNTQEISYGLYESAGDDAFKFLFN